jgi:uncharacterized membrane protein YkoI
MKKSLISTITATAIAVVTIAATSLTSFAADISLEQAKDIALKSAGLKASDVTFVKEKKEMDDGRIEYEIEFYSGNIEYDYDIDAATGAVVSFDQEIENFAIPATKTTVAASAGITKDQAIDIALKDAGYTKKDTLYVNVKKDFDDGMEVYEIEFRVGFVEYNYDINVANGQIVDFEIDD